MTVASIVAAYDADARSLARRYEAVTPESALADVMRHLPLGRPAFAVDVGSGSGRDAAWLASRGIDVVGVEPSSAMREEARRAHGDCAHWVEDRLPDLHHVLPMMASEADMVLLSGVWTHVPPQLRPRALDVVARLPKPGGIVAFLLRDGPYPTLDVGMWPTDPAELETACAKRGLERVSIALRGDAEGPLSRFSVVLRKV